MDIEDIKRTEVDQEEITALFDEWNEALQTRDPRKVAALYDSKSILLPTVSNKVRHNHEEIEDYFVHFLAKGPVGTLNESNVRSFSQIAINSGVYTFACLTSIVFTIAYN